MSAAGSTAGGESSNKNGCAACKHQRRRCKENECVLRRYFWSERMDDFLAAQKVFGLSNLTKHIQQLPEEDREKAVESFIWEANLWKEDPANGPLGQYRKLEQQNQIYKNQLDLLSRIEIVQNSDQLLKDQLMLQQNNQIMPNSALALSGLQGFNNGGIPKSCDVPANYGYNHGENSGMFINDSVNYLTNYNLPEQENGTSNLITNANEEIKQKGCCYGVKVENSAHEIKATLAPQMIGSDFSFYTSYLLNSNNLQDGLPQTESSDDLIFQQVPELQNPSQLVNNNVTEGQFSQAGLENQEEGST